MVLVRVGIHEPSEIVGTVARVSWFCALPSGGRGNRGNRGSIKEANGVTGADTKGYVEEVAMSLIECRRGRQAMERASCEDHGPCSHRTHRCQNQASTDESLW